MFADLLRIKKFRENAAQRNAVSAQAALDASRRLVCEKEDALAAYSEFRAGEEWRLFEEIKGEPIKKSRLDEMKNAVAMLRDDETKIEAELVEAKQTVPPAEEALQKARAAHLLAVKEVQKFEEFVSIQEQSAEKEVAAREEAEAEEMTEAAFLSRVNGGM